MAEANPSLHQAKLRASMGMATRVLAQQAALKATKRQMQSAGLKVNHFPLRELKVRAEAYLADHREELIAEARVIVSRWEAEGFFTRRRRAALKSPAQKPRA
jgi:hypothetical protein